ncbi:MAG: metal ABC transporter permease [Pseudomonadota bacterium]
MGADRGRHRGGEAGARSSRHEGGLILQALFDNTPLMIMATGALVGSAATLVGVFLVLRKNSMLSDAISHSIVFGIVIVWLLTHQQSGPVQLIGAALTGLITVFLTELLASTRRVKDDAAIGLVFPALFSIGVLLLNIYARGIHVDVHTVLLGEIGFIWLKTMTVFGYEIPEALVWMSVVTLVNAAFVLLFFKELKLTTFDPGLARALGFAPTAVFYALLMLTSTTAVAAFEAVGAVLFIAFVIVPPSAAYLLTDRLGLMLVLGIAIATASSVIGYCAAVALDVSIGGMMAVTTGGFLIMAFLFGPRYGVIAGLIHRWSERYVNESRALAVHLYHHEGQPECQDESARVALQTHLNWTLQKADDVVRRSLAADLVRQEGGQLLLTDKGRDLARQLLEPWLAKDHA